MKMLHLTNAAELLKRIPEGSISMFITSPPFWEQGPQQPAKRRPRRGTDGGRKHQGQNKRSRSKKPRSGGTAKDTE